MAARQRSPSALLSRASRVHKRIISGNSELHRFVKETMQPMLDRYAPTWWANAHVQVLLTMLVPQPRVQYKREVITFRDGGHSSLDWAQEDAKTEASQVLHAESPVVIILHGLTGCSASMRALCAEALANDFRAVVYNKRGHGGMKLATPKLQAFGCTADLKEAIELIQGRYPSAKLYGIGSSAGSGLLCSYLGETGAESKLDAGVLISPGYDARKLFIERRIHPMYDYLMTLNLKKFLLQHCEQLEDVIHVPTALKASSIREFDEQVYMKLNGYATLEEYWEHNNPNRAQYNIQKPYLCITAQDDPICIKELVPYDLFEENPIAMLIETGKGSHCAFYQGHMRLKSWADEAAISYLKCVHNYQGPIKAKLPAKDLQ